MRERERYQTRQWVTVRVRESMKEKRMLFEPAGK